jgi:hypothetical protein
MPLLTIPLVQGGAFLDVGVAASWVLEPIAVLPYSFAPCRS